jgi:hypothetical protein
MVSLLLSKSRTVSFLFFMVAASPAYLVAQTSPGFMIFGGTIGSISPSADGKRVQLIVNVLTAGMSVVVDENTTLTGSLGGRSSTATLTPGLFIEVQGWMASDGTVRASSIQTKVQSGAIRMYGRIENIIPVSGATALIIDGVEIRVDTLTTVLVNRGGLGVTGPVSSLAVGDSVDVTATYVDDTGVGQTTSGLFHASSIVVQRGFRIQGQIRSRTPATGNPTIIAVEGIVVTLTPDTAIVGNGMNERDEAFLSRNNKTTSSAPGTVSAIEDDAGDPCSTTPNACPDKPPSNPALAGDLKIGTFVRIEGMLENTGFSTRYTARLIQVEKPEQIRFQAIVESRTPTLLSVRLSEGIRTQVALDNLTSIDTDVAAGRLVDITAQVKSDLSILGRRIRLLP